MKFQDVGFILVFTMLLVLKRPKLFVYAGLVSISLSVPLFASWIFFTAERLTWYGAAFFLTFIFISLFYPHALK